MAAQGASRNARADKAKSFGGLGGDLAAMFKCYQECFN